MTWCVDMIVTRFAEGLKSRQAVKDFILICSVGTQYTVHSTLRVLHLRFNRKAPTLTITLYRQATLFGQCLNVLYRLYTCVK